MENNFFLLANSWPTLVILRNVPKFYNFPLKNLIPHMQGTRYTNPCFPVMTQHFEKYAHSIEGTTAILILDDYCSCKEPQVTPHAHDDHLPMLSMPVHTTHKLHGTCTAIYVSLSHHKAPTAIHVSNLMYVSCILWNFIIFVQPMHNIY